MDDETLCAALATSLDRHFERLVVSHQDRMYSTALRLLGDPRDAEEVAQDAFVRAYRALEGFEAPRIRELRLRPWLTAIVVNLSRNKRRRIVDRRPPVALPSPDEQPDLEPATDARQAPESIHGRRALRDRWAVLLGSVPERYRLPLILRHVDDLSYAEIAEALGRPEGTLKAQVHRGLAILRAAAESVDREELTA